MQVGNMIHNPAHRVFYFLSLVFGIVAIAIFFVLGLFLLTNQFMLALANMVSTCASH